MEGIGLSAVVRMAKRPRPDAPVGAPSQFTDMSGITTPTQEMAKPTKGLDAITRSLLAYVTIVTGASQNMNPELMMSALKAPVLLEREAHALRDAYTLHSGAVLWRMARVLVSGNPLDEADARRPGNEIVASVSRAVGVVARNLMFAILLGNEPPGLSDVFRMDSTRDNATYHTDPDAKFPARLNDNSPVDWGSGVRAVAESGRWADALLVTIRTPFAAEDCRVLFGRPTTDTVTPIGRGAGEVVERYMAREQADVAAALLIPANTRVPVTEHTILLGARVSIAAGSDMTFPLPPYRSESSFNALKPARVGGNRRDMLMNLAYTIFLLYSNGDDFAAWREATTNANLGFNDASLFSVRRDLLTLGYGDQDAVITALSSAAGTPFSDDAIAVSASTGVTAFADLVCFGATLMQTVPLVMIPRGSIIAAMSATRAVLRPAEGDELMVSPHAGSEIGIAISPEVRIWMDAVITDFHTTRPAGRDFFALPAQWMRGWTLNSNLASRVGLNLIRRAGGDAALLAAANTLLDAIVMGAPCPAAYGQVMGVLARAPEVQIADALRSVARQ